MPLQTERTIPDHAKTERWQKLALAAMKQSGRSFLPHVANLMTLRELFTWKKDVEVKIVAHEQQVSLSVGKLPQLISRKNVILIVGPEGGFSDKEIGECTQNGYIPLYLGERRLRTETAAIVTAALTLLQAE